MNHTQFWEIVNEACQSDPHLAEEWDRRLTEVLKKYAADEIVEWNHIFDRLAKAAYFQDMWGAAYHINGGASDDGFYYFRCWLIGMGKQVFSAAIADPDSLADVVHPDWDSQGLEAYAETYAAAHVAWMEVTGNSDEADYPARSESAELLGTPWDFDDENELRERIPRLHKLLEGRYD